MMLKKLSAVTLAAAVAAGAFTSGCAKKPSSKDSEALCAKLAEASVDFMKNGHPNVKLDLMKKYADDGKKVCVESYANLDEAAKNKRFKTDADIMKKCGAKKAKEFLDCAQPPMPEGAPGQPPAGNEGMPPGHEGMPAGHEGMPPGHEGMPAGHEGMTAPAQEAPAKDAPAQEAPAKDAPAKDAPAH